MSKKRTLSNSELSAFCAQMAYMVNAGISLQEALIIISGDNKDAEGARIMDEVLDVVESGGSFSEALRRSGRFPSYMVKMVEIGEASGRLEQVLNALSDYYNRQETTAKSIKSAITYPLVMIVMMIAVILVVVIQVLPVFQDVFSQLGGEMSGLVLGLMQFGDAVSQYAVVIIAVIAAIVVVFLVLRASGKGAGMLGTLGEHLFKKTSSAVASARFASAMSMMLTSGMDVQEAVEMAIELQSGKRARQKMKAIKELMDQGVGFAEAMVQSGVFSGMYGKMITVGFRTGTLDSVMQKIAQHYEEEAQRRMDAVVSALEPTLVAILSLIVGLILLSVMLPLIGVMSAIG